VARAGGRRVAVVDDVMTAGSSLSATCAALEAFGAVPAVAGALLVLGPVGEAHLAHRGIRVEAVARGDYAMRPAEACPGCASGLPLKDIARAAPGT
jgi:orotate phosphoribosyltransferase